MRIVAPTNCERDHASVALVTAFAARGAGVLTGPARIVPWKREP